MKNGAHECHTGGGRTGPPVHFTWDMAMKSSKEDLLSIKDNNGRFIRKLSQSLEQVGCETSVVQMFGSFRQPYNM